MRQKRYFTVRFNDLSDNKQEEIIHDITAQVINEKEEMEWAEAVGADPLKPSRADPDAVYDYARQQAEDACDVSWVELEVTL